ncbi:MAG: FAD-dependent oxidoreductase [Actinomycetota bacterium]|nr:FAD-dependent oxidoreductase [Actinomycetota bacterium]
MADAIIIGGGLGGLHAAHLLQERGLGYHLLEGSDRLGGRILSEHVDATGGSSGGAYDLGPAWYWPAFQVRMPTLVSALGLQAFPQEVAGSLVWEEAPDMHTRFEGGAPSDGSMRVAGGLGAIVDGVAAGLDGGRVHLGTRVVAMRPAGDGVEVDAVDRAGTTSTHRAPGVITALPLRLLAHSIRLEPDPGPGVLAAWSGVPTWMAGQAKVVAVYDTPFWREDGLSGEARSRVGPLVEIHDATAPGGLPALTGFVGWPADARRQVGDQLMGAVVDQLSRLFGPRASTPVAVLHKDWATDPLVATGDDAAPLKTHPHYGGHPLPGGPWEGRLLLAGTEAAPGSGGYMEGALEASELAVGGMRKN